MEVRRLPPCPDYDIRGTEKWLEEMAAQGYILCKGDAFQYGFAYFIKDEPKKLRYRLNTAPTANESVAGLRDHALPPEEDDQSFHADFGWEYITYRGQFHIYACEDETIPELHTDPQIEAISLQQATNRLRRQLVWLLIWGLFMCRPLHYGLFFAIWVEMDETFWLSRGVFLALACAGWLPGLIHLIRYRKGLKNGAAPAASGHRSRLWTTLNLLLRNAAFIWCVVTIVLWGGSTIRIYDISSEPEGYAFPSAASIFAGEEVTYTDDAWIYSWTTPTSPVNYKVREQFKLELENGVCTRGVLEVRYHETDAAWIAEGYARERRFTDCLFKSEEAVDVTIPGADWCAAAISPAASEFDEESVCIWLSLGRTAVIAELKIYDSSFPVSCTPEELAQAIVDFLS